MTERFSLANEHGDDLIPGSEDYQNYTQGIAPSSIRDEIFSIAWNAEVTPIEPELDQSDD